MTPVTRRLDGASGRAGRATDTCGVPAASELASLAREVVDDLFFRLGPG